MSPWSLQAELADDDVTTSHCDKSVHVAQPLARLKINVDRARRVARDAEP